MTVGATAIQLLDEIESTSGISKDSPDFATYLDKQDPLSSLKSQYDVPDGIYFCAHALGACPKTVGQRLQEEAQAWAKVGTKGHVEHPFDRPWVHTDVRNIEVMADIVGALPSEVVYASGLTTNLHMLLQSFYRPTAQKPKIIYEFDAFNSDRFALHSQVQLAGYDPATTLIGVKARPGEVIIRKEDVFAAIDEHGESACLVMFGAVNWGSGQLFDIPTITEYAHSKGCLVGWDIAHGVGNVYLELHNWNVDFAVWCSYKYLCAGPGATAGFFVHEKHCNSDRVRCSGWWGNDLSSRFITVPDFRARQGAAGFVTSNPSVFGTVPLHVSLDIYAQVPALCGASTESSSSKPNGTGSVDAKVMPHIRRKGDLLTGYLEYLLEEGNRNRLEAKCDVRLRCVSPKSVADRGSTLCVLFEDSTNPSSSDNPLDTSKYSETLVKVVERLMKRGVPVDSRSPNLIRFSPSPLYNSFSEARDLAMAVIESCLRAQ